MGASETTRQKRHATTDLKLVEEKSSELNGEEEEFKCDEEDEDCREKSEIIKRQADEEESDEVERLWSIVEERQKRSEQTEEDLETKTEEETQTETSETRREKRHATTDLKSVEEKSGELNGEEEVVKCDEEDEDCRKKREATTPAVV